MTPREGTRVPPHDLAAEESLLGAMLLSANAINAAVEEGVIASDFYKPANAFIYDACIDLHKAGSPVDPVTAADALRRDGHLEQIGGEPTLISLQSGTPAISNAGRYAQIVGEFASLRRLISIAGDIADMAYSLPDDANVALVATMHKLESWAQANTTHHEPLVSDLEAILEGVEPVLPKIGMRDDGSTALLYAPGVNWLSGEPGFGKSLLALWWCVAEIKKGNPVIYIDWEGTAHGLVSRMSEMGVSNDELHLMSYVRRVDPWDAASLSNLRKLAGSLKPTLVVFDAVAGAMDAEGLDPESNKDAEKWVAGLPVWLSVNCECAVLCIDHVVKNKETRGRWAIGAARKLGRADVAYTLDMKQPAGVGITSAGRLITGKDRYGSLAQYQAGLVVAGVAIHSQAHKDDEGHDLYVFLSKPVAGGDGGPDGYDKAERGGKVVWTPTWYMEQISKLLEAVGTDGMSEAKMRAVLGKNSTRITQACMALAQSGNIWREKPRRPWVSQKPYRQPETVPTMPPREHGDDDAPPEDDLGLF